MQKLKSLKRLDLNGCYSFNKLPVLPRSLIELHLMGTSIEQVPSSSIKHLSSLEKLMLYGCERLKSLPIGICKLKSLKHLDLNGCYSFDQLPVLPRNLIELDLTGTSIEQLSSSSIEHLSSLEKLTFYGCKKLKSLPIDICKLKSLQRLDLTYCYKLEIFPALLEHVEHLETLNFRESGIRAQPSLANLHFLTSLDLHSSNLSEIPDDIGRLSSITTLNLDGTRIEGIPVRINDISKLIELSISNCKRLKSLLELPWSLEHLDASGCMSLETISNSRDALRQGLRSGNLVITCRGYLYADCLKLDQNTSNNIVSEFQLRTLDTSIKSMQSQCGLKISDNPGVSICCPGNKILMWFAYQLEGSSKKIRLPSNRTNTKFLGFALCTVVAENILGLDLCCEANFKTNYGESFDFFWDFNNLSTLVLDFNSSNVFMWYRHENYHDCLDEVEVSFCFYDETEESKVTACGIRPLYLQDAEEHGITKEHGKSNATSTEAITCKNEPHPKRIKTSTFNSQ